MTRKNKNLVRKRMRLPRGRGKILPVRRRGTPRSRRVRIKTRRFKIGYEVAFKIPKVREPIVQVTYGYVTTRKKHVTKKELLEKARVMLQEKYHGEPAKIGRIFF